MNCEPIDINLERATTFTREKQPRHGSPARPYFAAKNISSALPEAFDEVFATLARSPIASQSATPTILPAKPSLETAPLVTLAAGLERQHERLASFLREIETGAAAS